MLLELCSSGIGRLGFHIPNYRTKRFSVGDQPFRCAPGIAIAAT